MCPFTLNFECIKIVKLQIYYQNLTRKVDGASLNLQEITTWLHCTELVKIKSKWKLEIAQKPLPVSYKISSLSTSSSSCICVPFMQYYSVSAVRASSRFSQRVPLTFIRLWAIVMSSCCASPPGPDQAYSADSTKCAAWRWCDDDEDSLDGCNCERVKHEIFNSRN